MFECALRRCWPLGRRVFGARGNVFGAAGFCSPAPRPRPRPRPALYLPGSMKSEVAVVVQPDLDMGRVLAERETAAANLRARGLADVDAILDGIAKGHEELERIEKKVGQIEEKSKANGARLAGLLSKKDEGTLTKDEETEMEALRSAAKTARAEVKPLHQRRWELEETVVQDFLRLPNVQLHERCPRGAEAEVLHEAPAGAIVSKPRGHVALAGSELKFTRDRGVYLEGRLARYEYELGNRLHGCLLAAGLEPMSGPDLIRSLIVEGCDADYADPARTLALEPAQDFQARSTGQALHLVGGASVYPMAAFLIRQLLAGGGGGALPLGFFCLGRQYRPWQEDAESSLFNTRQSTAAEALGFAATAAAARDLFDEYLENVVRPVYDGLGLPYRLRDEPASRLANSESRRVSIQIFAPGLNDHVTVGHLASHDDYLSKRLMLKYEPEKGERLRNLHAIGGTLVDLTKVIGCAVECEQDERGDFRLEFDEL